MSAPDVTHAFATLDGKEPPDAYNFTHFRTRHLVSDVLATLQRWGIAPGALAPDFALASVDGDTVRLSDLRGTPVLLHFGSFT